MKKIAFLFPGQGAQTVGMGKDFYNQYAQAREVFQEGDEILQRSLSKIIFEGPADLLTETRNSQAGIYLTSIAILRVLEKELPDIKPFLCAGLSLGEYTALTASGRLPFETTVSLVQLRSEAMNAACEATKGTMAAIFGLSADVVEAMVKELGLPNDLWVANFNCPGQTVISGTLKGVQAGIEAAKALGAKRTIPLQVHGAFHSGLMSAAQQALTGPISQATILDSQIKLVMNVSGGIVSEKEAVRDHLIRQITSPVRWEQSIRSTMSDIELYVEIGPGKVLAGLNRQIGVSAPTVTINKIEDLEHLAG